MNNFEFLSSSRLHIYIYSMKMYYNEHNIQYNGTYTYYTHMAYIVYYIITFTLDIGRYYLLVGVVVYTGWTALGYVRHASDTQSPPSEWIYKCISRLHLVQRSEGVSSATFFFLSLFHFSSLSLSLSILNSFSPSLSHSLNIGYLATMDTSQCVALARTTTGHNFFFVCVSERVIFRRHILSGRIIIVIGRVLIHRLHGYVRVLYV